MACLAIAVAQHSAKAQFNGTLSKEVLSSWIAKERIIEYREMNLTRREITQLDTGVFTAYSTNTVSVDLQHNKLKRIKADQFEGLFKVISLNLSHNELEWLDPQAFRFLFNLLTIDLSHNKLTTQSDQAFRYLSHVYNMNLSHNLFKSVPNARLKSVWSFDMSYNQIERVDGQVFDRVLSEGAQVAFSFNQIKYIDYKSFNENCMKKIVIRGNPIEANFTFNLSQATYSQTCMNLEVVDYRDPTNPPKINLTTEKLQEWNLFENRSQTRLLDLSSRKIEHFDKEVFTDYERLNYLHLENNSISRVTDKYFYSLRYSLLELYLDNNRLSSITTNYFTGLEKLQVLSLSGNRLEWVSAWALDDLTSLIWLFLNSNRIKYIDANCFSETKSLRFLDLSDNKILYFLRDEGLTSLTSLSYLNLSDNYFKIIKGNSFSSNQGLVKLDLSRCLADQFSKVDELNKLCLQELNLGDNNLRGYSWDYDESKGCIVVKNLTTSDVFTTPWETTIQTTTGPINDTDTEWNDYSDYEGTDIRDPKKTRTKVSPFLIVFMVVLASGLTIFLVFIISFKVRRQRALTPSYLHS